MTGEIADARMLPPTEFDDMMVRKKKKKRKIKDPFDALEEYIEDRY